MMKVPSQEEDIYQSSHNIQALRTKNLQPRLEGKNKSYSISKDIQSSKVSGVKTCKINKAGFHQFNAQAKNII